MEWTQILYPNVQPYFSDFLAAQWLSNATEVQIKTLNTFWGHFGEIFDNYHQYRKVTIETNIRIAKTYFLDLESSISDERLKYSFETIFKWLVQKAWQWFETSPS